MVKTDSSERLYTLESKEELQRPFIEEDLGYEGSSEDHDEEIETQEELLIAVETLLSELRNRQMLGYSICHPEDFDNEKVFLDRRISTLEYIKTRSPDLIDPIS